MESLASLRRRLAALENPYGKAGVSTAGFLGRYVLQLGDSTSPNDAEKSPSAVPIAVVIAAAKTKLPSVRRLKSHPRLNALPHYFINTEAQS